MPTKTKHQPGEYMTMYWDGTPDEEYVHGHVTPGEFLAVLKREHPRRTHQATPPPVEHAWGRHGFASESLRADGCDRQLYTHSAPGRGRFKITVVKWEDLYPKATEPHS